MSDGGDAIALNKFASMKSLYCLDESINEITWLGYLCTYVSVRVHLDFLGGNLLFVIEVRSV